jgi:hypothetical protein
MKSYKPYRKEATEAATLLVRAIQQAKKELIYYPDDAPTIITEKNAMETALDALSFTWKSTATENGKET